MHRVQYLSIHFRVGTADNRRELDEMVLHQLKKKMADHYNGLKNQEKILTPETKNCHINRPYLLTTFLQLKLTIPSAPMAWLICVTTV